jgi:hypothetical protein
VTREVLRALGRDIVHLYQEIVDEDDAERSHIPELHNTDGHLLVLCKETWRFAKSKRAGVISRVRKLGLEPDGEPGEVPLTLVWSREDAGGSSGTVLGRITVSTNEISLETNSKERLGVMKPQLLDALDGIATHIRSEEQSQDELRAAMANARDTSDGDQHGDAECSVSPEVEREVVRGYLERHYSTWPDVALPALGGKTPREALASKAGRADVEALIRDMEHRSHDSAMEGAYDFDDLRRSLGLAAARGPLG